jgi:hypothetical protein
MDRPVLVGRVRRRSRPTGKGDLRRCRAVRSRPDRAAVAALKPGSRAVLPRADGTSEPGGALASGRRSIGAGIRSARQHRRELDHLRGAGATARPGERLGGGAGGQRGAKVARVGGRVRVCRETASTDAIFTKLRGDHEVCRVLHLPPRPSSKPAVGDRRWPRHAARISYSPLSPEPGPERGADRGDADDVRFGATCRSAEETRCHADVGMRRVKFTRDVRVPTLLVIAVVDMYATVCARTVRERGNGTTQTTCYSVGAR